MANLFPLQHYQCIEISGVDAATFLQGQLTCDVQHINTQHSNMGAYCNLQGRIVSLFRIYQARNAFYLLMPKELIVNTQKTLQRYVLFSKVKICEMDFSVVGITGEDAYEVLERL